ncbi:MAG: hypothetical protein K8R90_05910 [Candidatus Cloacimonetes bacterium]|nr:hypothetical protein [Candidatus Cloacimonadota bacterium]
MLRIISGLSLLSLMLAAIFLSGCGGDSTEPSSNSIIGQVLLDGETDHSGITIAVYATPQDSELEAIRHQYPQTGMSLSNPLFDHRFHTPLATIETDADGNFKISGLSIAEYIVVAFKSDFGFRYFYYQIPGARNDWPVNVALYPETPLSGSLTNGYTFESEHHYIVTQNLWLTGSQTFVFEPGAWFRIDPNMTVDVSAPISLQGNAQSPFHITSNDGLTAFSQGLDPAGLSKYYQVKLGSDAQPQGGIIEWGLFSLGQKGLDVQVNSVTMRNCLLEHCFNGVVFSLVQEAHCTNLLVRDNNHTGAIGIAFETLETGSLAHNVILGNATGMKVQTHYMGSIEDNLFQSNTTGLEFNQTVSTINNNEFYQNSYVDVLFSHNQNPTTDELTVHHNVFGSNSSMRSRELNQFYSPSMLHINYNEFNSSAWFIYLYGYGGDEDVNARYNYFDGLNSESDIKERVWDRDDDNVAPFAPIVDVSYFYTTPPDAGIR